MKKLLSILFAVAFIFGCLAMTACGETESLDKAYNKYLKECTLKNTDGLPTLTVAMSPDFAPMEFVDLAKSGSNQYVGFDVLLANYIAKELNMKLLIKPMSFDACMAAVQSGNADLAISGFSWTAARAETFLITDYYVAGENETEQVVITTKANAGKLTKASDFSGLKVGAQGGSLQELLVTEQLVTAGAQIVKMENLAVAKGNGDAFIADNKDSIDFSGFRFEVEEKYKNNVILVGKNNAELCEKVNKALAKAMSENVYDDWYEACQIYSGIKTKDDLGYDDEGNKISE